MSAEDEEVFAVTDSVFQGLTPPSAAIEKFKVYTVKNIEIYSNEDESNELMHHNAPHVTDRGNFVIIGQTANGWGSLNVYSVLSKNRVVSGCPAAAEFEFDCSCYTTETERFTT